MYNIKTYIELNREEKLKAYEYIKSEENFNDSFEQIEQMYNTKIHDYGKGVLFYFRENKIVASLCIVLEVAKVLNTAYIHKVSLKKETSNSHIILQDLINRAIDISKEYGAKDIRIGISDDFIIKQAQKIDITPQYKSIEMSLEEKNKIYKTLDIKELNEENKYKYVEIYTDSFSDMPHGTITDIHRVNELLENKRESNKQEYYYIVCDKEKEIGFMEVVIENNKGVFDIGLCKSYRRKGYGKRILETAIQFLLDKNINEIGLIVIEENKIAYNMYQKRGFKFKNTLGYWSKL
ncbi:MAG: GNAT family N-acetyltransferase [Peptostreptococcaceae bacterium]